jgi:hypothetical protein
MLENIWQDTLLRYTILFSLKMIVDGHTPPQDMADAIVNGLHRHGCRTAEDIQAVQEAMMLMYVTGDDRV